MPQRGKQHISVSALVLPRKSADHSLIAGKFTCTCRLAAQYISHWVEKVHTYYNFNHPFIKRVTSSNMRQLMQKRIIHFIPRKISRNSHRRAKHTKCRRNRHIAAYEKLWFSPQPADIACRFKRGRKLIRIHTVHTKKADGTTIAPKLSEEKPGCSRQP